MLGCHGSVRPLLAAFHTMKVDFEDVEIVDVREEQLRHWKAAFNFSLIGSLIVLWLTSKRSTALLGTSVAIVAFYLGYLYAKEDIEGEVLRKYG